MGIIVRYLFVLCLLFLTSGCAVWDYFIPCDDCPLAIDESFQSDDKMGVLAIGLTVIPDVGAISPNPDEGLEGDIGWLVNSLEAQDPDHPLTLSENQDLRELRFPPGLIAGHHRLVLWRVPAGQWALRHGRMGTGSDSLLTQVLKPWGSTTRVSPGRIAYAGEIRISANAQGKNHGYILGVGYDPQFAHKALEEFTQVSAPMDDAPLTELRREKLRGH